MKFFKKQLDQDNNNLETKPTISLGDLPPYKTVQQLLERFAGIAYEKQLNLATVIGENNWDADFKQGQISFGPKLVFSMQIFGSYSYDSESWLWSWANDKSGFIDKNIEDAKLLKKYGEENGIELFSAAHFKATINDLHLMGLMISGLFNASAYYVAGYGNGAFLFTINSEQVDQVGNNNDQRILTIFPELISQILINHRHALSNYLSLKDYNIVENGQQLTATKDNHIINAEFDQSSQLISLNGNEQSANLDD